MRDRLPMPEPPSAAQRARYSAASDLRRCKARPGGALPCLLTALLLGFAVWPAIADERLPQPVPEVRELLDLFHVAPEQFSSASADAFAAEGDEHLWRWLYAAKRFLLKDFDRWKLPGLTPASLARGKGGPQRYIGQIVAWSGMAQQVSVVKLRAQFSERFGFSECYRCRLSVGEGHQPVDVYALHVPSAWQPGKAINERASVVGFVARLPVADDGAVRPVLVARRVAWFPETVLGDLGMDAGLFDELSEKPELTAEDRECFYQLLAAVGRGGPRQLLRFAGDDAGVEPLFNEPNKQRGQLFSLAGTARQAVLRRVDDPDVRARFGIDHYYEIELFTNDSQGNPLTFCVRELPPEFPQSGQLFEPVRIAGFYLKRWSYRIRQPVSGAAGPPRRQLSPLLIGRAPVWLEPATNDSRVYTAVFIGAFVVFTAALWLAVWRWNRSGQKFHNEVLKRFGAAPATSLNEAGLDDQGRPDFSHLS
jgi:hypothetical protein